MKRIIYRVLHWAQYGIIALVLGVVVAFSLLYLGSLGFASHHAEIERVIGQVIQRPIKIGRVSLGSRGLEPVFKLHEVAVFNQNSSQKFLQAEELAIGIDVIRSLIGWQFRSDFLSIRGCKIIINQDLQRGWYLENLHHVSGEIGADIVSPIHEVLSWIASQNRIKLRDFSLICRASNGDVVKLEQLNLELQNGVLQHQLSFSGIWPQTTAVPAKLRGHLIFHGDLAQGRVSAVKGWLELENWLSSHGSIENQRLASWQDLIPNHGALELRLSHCNLNLPWLRQERLINSGRGAVVWQRGAAGWDCELTKVKLVADGDLKLVGGGQIWFPFEDGLPKSDLEFVFKLADLSHVSRYYPAILMNPNALVWLDQAFIRSKGITGKLILRGDWEQFPFDNGEGMLLVASKIRDVELNYDNHWPRIKRISGEMVFHNRSMRIQAHTAEIMGEPVKSILAIIPDLATPILQIDGVMIGVDSQQGLQFVEASPLRMTVGRNLKQLELDGRLDLNLQFTMPLAASLAQQKTRLTGKIGLEDNLLTTSLAGIRIEKLGGEILFTEDSIQAEQLHGLWWYQPVKIVVKMLYPDSQRAAVQTVVTGQMQIANLAEILAVKLAPYANGAFNYQINLNFPSFASVNSCTITSDLEGAELQLPTFLFKAKEDARPLQLITTWDGGSSNYHAQLQYGDRLRANFVIQTGSAGELRVVRGGLRLGDKLSAPPLPEQGWAIGGRMAQLNLDSWRSWVVQKMAHLPTLEGISSVIQQISLQIGQLQWGESLFQQVDLKAVPQQGRWKIWLKSPKLEGEIYLPSASHRVLKGIFSKFCWIDFTPAVTSKLVPTKLPPLELEIKNLQYDTQNLGALDLVTEPQVSGMAIRRLKLKGPQFTLNATGGWQGQGARVRPNQTHLQGTVESGDLGGLLRSWKLTDDLVGGQGSLDFNMNWLGAPYQPNLDKIAGEFSVKLHNGRIVNLGQRTETKLGFSRILGVLSLQSLPRRLSLDFSDLTKQGFHFDQAVGSLVLQASNLTIKNLILDGTAAKIWAHGKVGLKKKDYDLTLSVTPRLTSSIPVAAAIAGGPVGGVLGIIADTVISSAIKRSPIYSYHVSGQWEKPLQESSVAP